MSHDETVRAEARAWLRRLASGEATREDAEALATWRGRSPFHARAFTEAAILWQAAGEATALAGGRERAALAAIQPSGGRRLARRAVLAGGTALAASVAVATVVRPPFQAWPSLSELSADYRTRTGERRTIAIASRIAVELNTRSSMDVRPATDDVDRVDLLAGEAAIAKRGDPSRSLVVQAGRVSAETAAASFDIRRDGTAVRVTCIDGEVAVRDPSRGVLLRAGEQVAGAEEGLGEVAGVDPEVVTAWQRGLLIFRREPLSHVVDEVNRYRPGLIVLVDGALARRQVIATFRLDRIEEAVDFIAEAMRIKTRSLPGGVVLVG